MRRAYALLAASFMIACSDRQPEARVVEGRAPTPATTEPPAPAPEPPAPAPEPPTTAQPVAQRALQLPDEIPPIEQLRGRTITALPFEPTAIDVSVRYPSVAHPDAAVRRSLDRVIASIGRQVPPGLGEIEPECRATLAHPKLFSMMCSTPVLAERGGNFEARFATYSFAIDGDELRPVTVEHALSPASDDAPSSTSDLAQRGLARCQARVRQLAAQPNSSYAYARCGPVSDAFGFGARGVHVFYDVAESGGTPVGVVIPYAELRERIRADGPLAPVLGPADAQVARAQPSEAEASGWAVTRHRPAEQLIGEWDRLDDRAGVLVLRSHDPLARLVVPNGDRERAATLAARFEGPLDRVAWAQTPPRPEWVRAARDLNVRADGLVPVLVPSGTWVVALVGDDNRPGTQGAWAEAYVGAEVTGRIAARWLRADAGCRPDPSAFAASLDGDAPRPLVASVAVRRDGRRAPAALFAAVVRGHVELALYAMDDACQLGERILAARAAGPLSDLRLTGTTRNGGDTLVVLGTRRSEDERGTRLRYAVYHVGRSQPVLTTEVTQSRLEWRSEAGESHDVWVRVGEQEGGRYWPLSIEERRYAWVNGELREEQP